MNGADVEAFQWMNPFVFAKDVGRIVAVLRFGNKEPTEQELQGMAAPSRMPPGCVPGEGVDPACEAAQNWRGVPALTAGTSVIQLTSMPRASSRDSILPIRS